MSHLPEALSRPKLTQACAECRRLKLKCDKNKPCSSCIRRGCPSICPEGRMVSKGSRFILANTEQLHRKIDALLNRVHALEGALESACRYNSNEVHPLLTEEHRLIATPLDSAAAELEHTVKEELAEGVGTLTLYDHGVRYFGATGSFSELWRDDGDANESLRKADRAILPILAQLPPEIANLAYSFPFRLTVPIPSIALHSEDLASMIMQDYLPSSPEAWSLFESYWEHYAWHFTPVSRKGFISRILNPLYHKKDTLEASSVPLSHQLGVLFGVFAIGELLDFTRPLNQSSGLRYYLIGRACLAIDSVIESPTVTALQGMLLLAAYGILSRGSIEPEHIWVLSGICLKVASILGLQHDPSKFSLPLDEIEDRWYAVNCAVSLEMWQALASGRPALGLKTFTSPRRDPGGDEDPRQPGRRWAASFIREVASTVVETVVATEPISYNNILQLDAKIRAFPPFSPDPELFKDVEEMGIGERLQRASFGMMRDAVMLLLHRRCFALALRDYPEDPLASPFAPSVMACYRSASVFVTRMQTMLMHNKTAMQRIWFFWPNVFAGTLILGSIVARSPNCSIALKAYKDLQTAIRLWEQAPQEVGGTKVLDAIEQLKKKAAMAMAQKAFLFDSHSATSSSGVEITDEIQALGGGGPRVLSRPSRGTSSHGSSPRYPPSIESSPSPPQGGTYVPDTSVVQSPQSTNYNQTPEQQSQQIPVSYIDPSKFMGGNLYSDVSNMAQATPQSMNYPTADFNDIFGITQHAGSDIYGSEVLFDQLGFGEDASWQPMDHVGF